MTNICHCHYKFCNISHDYTVVFKGRLSSPASPHKSALAQEYACVYIYHKASGVQDGVRWLAYKRQLFTHLKFSRIAKMSIHM